jgi:hypothetical protein
VFTKNTVLALIYALYCVADPDPVGSGPFWSDPDPNPDPDVWDRIRIRILALTKDFVSTFLVYVKAINTCTYGKFYRVRIRIRYRIRNTACKN